MPSFKSLEILNSDSGKPYGSIASKKKSDIYVNGGFHVIDKSAIKYIKNTRDYWEDTQLRRFKSIK